MANSILLLSLVLAFLSAFAYCQENELTPFIFGGRESRENEYASDCLIQTPHLDPHCQGVLIDRSHVLTAASCVMTGRNERHEERLIHPAWIRVVCGDSAIDASHFGREVRSVSHIYPYDRYVPIHNNNDLAVLRLDEPIALPHISIEPATFRKEAVADGTTCYFSGWGFPNNATRLVPTQKRIILTPIVNRVLCNSPAFAHPYRALVTMLCAGLHTPVPPTNLVNESVCHGNVGGALYCNGEVVGILSFGLGCRAPNHVGIYTQTRLFNDWIDSCLTRTDTIPDNTLYPRW